MSNQVQDILAQLLAFDTTSRESNLALIGMIREFLAARGVSAQQFTNESGSKANLYARIGPQGPGGVMLSGHTDTVPVDGQNWSVPPFMLTEKNGRYYGRGSADMKGFLACMLASVDTFLSSPLRMPLHLAFSYDEEVGCLGVRSLVDWLRNAEDRPAMCIIGEPTEMQPVYGHKGKLAMRCQVHGHACHSAQAPEGVNAISYAAKVMTQLGELGEQLALHQDTRFSPAFSTVQVGTIQGGSALNIVPANCSFDFEVRYLPGVQVQTVAEKLQAWTERTLVPEMKQVAHESAITFHTLSHYPGLLAETQSEFARLLSGWCGSESFSTVAFGTEAGLFHEVGIATLICGPGSMAQGHKADEFIAIEQLDNCMLMLNNLCAWMTAPDANA